MASTIPTEEDSETWLYPSEQMFYNAMKRSVSRCVHWSFFKFSRFIVHPLVGCSKGHAPLEQDMRTVVAIHNTVNEQTWKQILEWEAFRGGDDQKEL